MVKKPPSLAEDALISAALSLGLLLNLRDKSPLLPWLTMFAAHKVMGSLLARAPTAAGVPQDYQSYFEQILQDEIPDWGERVEALSADVAAEFDESS